MREIKFRAWDSQTDKPKMVDWKTLLQDYNLWWILTEQGADTHVHVMQYTGLKDKNGKEIYEGDIVKEEGEGTYEVSWGAVGCDYHGGVGFMLGDPSLQQPHRYEVIGNIYENPELTGSITTSA